MRPCLIREKQTLNSAVDSSNRALKPTWEARVRSIAPGDKSSWLPSDAVEPTTVEKPEPGVILQTLDLKGLVCV